MTIPKRFLYLAFLILAAIICYIIGSSSGIIIFVILGIILELIFWLGLFSKPSKKAQKKP